MASPAHDGFSGTQAREGETPQAYIERMLREQIVGFDGSRQYYRRRYFIFTAGTALLSAATTVFIAVGKFADWHNVFSIASLITSAAITVVSAFDGFLRSRELWIQKTDAWMALQRLDATLQYSKTKSAGTLPEAEIDVVRKDFDRILQHEHDSWKKVRNTQGSQSRK